MQNTDVQIKNTDLTVVKYVPTYTKSVEKFIPEDENRKSDTVFLRFTVIIGILLFLEATASSVWSSSAIVKLQSNDTNSNPLGRPITTVEISILVGIPGMGSILGAILLPKLADIIGRKTSLHAMGFGMLFSIVGLAFSSQINLMTFFITFVLIFGVGVWSVLPIYITEICEDHNRARYGSLMAVFSPIGQLYSYAIGSAFSLRNYTLLMAVPLLPSVLFFFFVPESPVYSLLKKRKSDSVKALNKLRINKSDKEIEGDVNAIFQSLTIINTSDENKETNIMKVLGKKEGRLGLMLALLPNLGQTFCGVPILLPLLAPIFNESGSNLSGSTIAIIVGIVTVITYAFTSLVIEKTGRKPMLILSTTGAGMSISILGIFFYLKYMNSPIVQQFQWIPLACVLVYMIFYSLGLGPMPMALMSELFEPNCRSTAITIVSTISNLVSSVYLAVFPLLSDLIGTYSCLFVFGASCFINAILFIVLLPETKGKSIVEIQEILKYYQLFKHRTIWK